MATNRRFVLRLLLIGALTLVTVWAQLHQPDADGMLKDAYTSYEQVMRGTAVLPDQYRLLSQGLTALVAQFVGAIPALIVLRVLVGLLVFGTLTLWLHVLKATSAQLIVGLSVFAYAMVAAYAETRWGIDTYLDVSLCLLGACCLQAKRYRWIVLITLIGALNRETIVLLPAAVLALRAAAVLHRRDPARAPAVSE